MAVFNRPNHGYLLRPGAEEMRTEAEIRWRIKHLQGRYEACSDPNLQECYGAEITGLNWVLEESNGKV